MKKNGFTLIELLGTIVILGLIALIATPPIINQIKNSKKKVADATLRVIYSAGESYIKENKNSYSLDNGTKICLSIQQLSDEGKIKDSFIKQQNLRYNQTLSFTVGAQEKLTYDLKLYDDGCQATSTSLVSRGLDVYFNPIDGVPCKSGYHWTPTNPSTNCYRWYVLATSPDGFEEVELILDHEITTSALPWSGTSLNVSGPDRVLQQLRQLTQSYQNVIPYTKGDTVVRPVTGNYRYTISYEGEKARLISAEELASISDIPWRNGMIAENKSVYSWLKPTGSYWTDTAYKESTNEAYRVNSQGLIQKYDVKDTSENVGIRPIIKIYKKYLRS